MFIKTKPLSLEDTEKLSKWLRVQVDNPPAIGTVEGILFELAMDVVSAQENLPLKLTPEQYSEFIDLPLELVMQKLKEGSPLTYITSVESIGGEYFLTREVYTAEIDMASIDDNFLNSLLGRIRK